MSTYSNWTEVKSAFESSEDFRSNTNKNNPYEKFFYWVSKNHLTPIKRIERIEVGNLCIDQERREVTVGGKNLKIPRKIFNLLVFFASNPGRVFTREQILEIVWGNEVVVLERTVDVHVLGLRKILGLDIIESIKGVGYRFVKKDHYL